MRGCPELSSDQPNDLSPSEREALSAFAPENFGPVVLIQLMRLYDVQMALLSCYDAEKAAYLAEMHEAGLSFTPPPAFALEDDVQEDAGAETTPEDV